MNIQALALAFLAATAIGGLAWVFIYPLLSGEKKAEHRRASVAKSEPVARNADKNQRSRREQVEGSLKELEARRQKEKSLPLSSRLTQAGLTWSPQKFMIISGILGAVSFAMAMLGGGWSSSMRSRRWLLGRSRRWERNCGGWCGGPALGPVLPALRVLVLLRASACRQALRGLGRQRRQRATESFCSRTPTRICWRCGARWTNCPRAFPPLPVIR